MPVFINCKTLDNEGNRVLLDGRNNITITTNIKKKTSVIKSFIRSFNVDYITEDDALAGHLDMSGVIHSVK